MTRIAALLFATSVAIISTDLHAQSTRTDRTSRTAAYFPERFDWQHKQPSEIGMNPALVDEAVKTAIAAESKGSKNMQHYLVESYSREPFDTPIGPIKDRGSASGVVVHNGYIVAEWGDPSRVDMTFSVTKTFLTTVVGLAWQRGLIKDVNDEVRPYMPAGVDLFAAAHNQTIKWDHLLRQTSDWQGTLWGKPDWADRPEGQRPAEWPNRALYEPGTHFKYNDVRVNVMALAALHVWRRPLPDVLREELMDPIGASSSWQWNGYDNSWIEVDGKRVQSVSGGGHWGGGMFINSYDMARFGYLFLRNGKWKDKTIVADKWIQMARTPGTVNETYGYANWYLNTVNKRSGQRALPDASASAVYFVGNGNNIIYIDWEHDLLVVFRWVDSTQSVNNVVGKLIASMTPGTSSRK
jgi:CubicO group peptidase (beta-lactamase class C family)